MSERPVRIQRKRTKGWRLPDGAVVVTRGTEWGNPFTVAPGHEPGKKIGGFYTAVPTVEDAVECFREWAENQPKFIERVRSELRGKDLACWCALDAKCHADVLLALANPHTETGG